MHGYGEQDDGMGQLADSVAKAVRLEMFNQELTQVQLTQRINEQRSRHGIRGMTRSALARRLNGRTAINMDELEEFARALGKLPRVELDTIPMPGMPASP